MIIKRIMYRILIKRRIRKDSSFREYLNKLKESLKINEEILGVEMNIESLVIVTKLVSDNSVYIMLNSPKYIVSKPRITGVKENYDKRDIKIGDIQTEDNNIGNGSILMKYFIKVAKEMKFSNIYGDISIVDKDHWDRLIHYYKKFGFKVSFNKEYTRGEIQLNLLSN
ncbi:hypothetical protein ACQPUY_15455 [Clostridium nigeriense]|uniref:hypothetical protein n=1 Tax=Clostridium nigeriense TaxID=1805470 RepID=UPI003D332AF5